MRLTARRTARYAVLVTVVLMLASGFAKPACGGLVDDSFIYYHHYNMGSSEFFQTATTFFEGTYYPDGPSYSTFSSPHAEITAGAIRTAIAAQAGASFPVLSASVRDFYLLEGTGVDLMPGLPGTQVHLPVSLNVEGVADRTFVPELGGIAGGLQVTLNIGHDLYYGSAGVLGGSPVIQEVGGQKSTNVEAPPSARARRMRISTFRQARTCWSRSACRFSWHSASLSSQSLESLPT